MPHVFRKATDSSAFNRFCLREQQFSYQISEMFLKFDIFACDIYPLAKIETYNL